MNILSISKKHDWPSWLDLEFFVNFLHKHMSPYEDAPEDIRRGLGDALSEQEGKGGLIVLGIEEGSQKLIGAVVMLRTGMSGYIPENIVLFACVDPDYRGKGYGKTLLQSAMSSVDGDIKLHVEYDNPAKRLYERLGFTNKYAEMRFSAEKKD